MRIAYLLTLVVAFLFMPSSAMAEEAEEADPVEAASTEGEEEVSPPVEGEELTPTPEVPEAAGADDLPDGIQLVPVGSYLVLPPNGEGLTLRYRVPRKSFLLPELHYDNALIKAKQLDICQPALDRCTETSLDWQKRTYDALTTCSDQFDSDEALVQDLTSQVQSMETRALVAEDRLKVARKNQAVAWGITGGVVLGAVTVIVVSLAN